VAGFLAFLSAIGSGAGVTTTYAASGDFCKIRGPSVMSVGQTATFTLLVEDARSAQEADVDLDDESGDSDIVRVNSTATGPTDFVDDASVQIEKDWDPECGQTVLQKLINCIDDDDCIHIEGEDYIEDIADAILALLEDGVFSCAEASADAEDVAILAGEDEGPAGLDGDDVDSLCLNDFEEDTWLEGTIAIQVKCEEAGVFELSFADDSDVGNTISTEVTCVDAPDSSSTIAVVPNKVEIVPAMGSVSHALVTVELLADGEQAGAGFEVDFTVNICSIETSGVDTASEYTAARTIFSAYNPNVPATADAVQASAAANAAVDGTRLADTVKAFVATFSGDDHTIAAAVLGCGPEDTGSSVTSPGTATITAIIEVDDGQDIVKTITVNVVGPPAKLTALAAPSSLRCGEKATITVTVKDSLDQNVSDHTRVEAVTNAGGVLGGTGAVAGLAGPVVPISSTIAETFGGVATFYLLTSEQHSGPYEVVITTGGAGAVTTSLGGVFSTPPQVTQVTVSCALPTAVPPAAAAPTVTAPRTGGGVVSPPNTGDAGLADSSGSSWALFAVAGVVAFSVAGLATLKFARR
jgi:hypothetical protein